MTVSENQPACQDLCESDSNRVTEVADTRFGHTRRTALKGLAAALATIGASSFATSAQAASKTYKVCKTTDVAVGSARMFAVNGQPVAITQPKKGTFKAFSGWCTHEQNPLTQGAGAIQTSGGNMICSRHGARFSTTSGAATGGPASGKLTSYALKVSGTQITITV